jgi:alkanesulfonate monooxygenase SsuD/methylene tetrahydromethanopterin reductase-like flavin-dependent oxidoreductase (luciferase family)
MRVASNIALLTLLNPVELAENAATLDAITGGRFVLGVGLGYRPEEFDAFGFPEKKVRIFLD